jgi:hypothetical protein
MEFSFRLTDGGDLPACRTMPQPTTLPHAPIVTLIHVMMMMRMMMMMMVMMMIIKVKLSP